jgi:flagellin-like hook-associated protein FlgL
MALQMVVFSRSQILQQAGTSILAQASVLPQVVFQLLR